MRAKGGKGQREEKIKGGDMGDTRLQCGRKDIRDKVGDLEFQKKRQRYEQFEIS